MITAPRGLRALRFSGCTTLFIIGRGPYPFSTQLIISTCGRCLSSEEQSAPGGRRNSKSPEDLLT